MCVCVIDLFVHILYFKKFLKIIHQLNKNLKNYPSVTGLTGQTIQIEVKLTVWFTKLSLVMAQGWKYGASNKNQIVL